MFENFIPKYLQDFASVVKSTEDKTKAKVVCSCGCEEFDYYYLFFKFVMTEEEKQMIEIDKRADEMEEKRIGPYKKYKRKERCPCPVWTGDEFDGIHYWILFLDEPANEDHKSLEEVMKDPNYLGHVEKSPYDPNKPTEYEYIYAKCKRCGKEILLFDDRYYGYDGVCTHFETPNKPYLENGKIKMKKSHCEGAGYKIYVTISSTGKEDLIDEEDSEFINEKNWKDAFEWIKIDLECAKCGKKKTALNLETM